MTAGHRILYKDYDMGSTRVHPYGIHAESFLRSVGPPSLAVAVGPVFGLVKKGFGTAGPV